MSDDGALSPASAASKLDSFILEDDELRQAAEFGMMLSRRNNELEAANACLQDELTSLKSKEAVWTESTHKYEAKCEELSARVAELLQEMAKSTATPAATKLLLHENNSLKRALEDAVTALKVLSADHDTIQAVNDELRAELASQKVTNAALMKVMTPTSAQSKGCKEEVKQPCTDCASSRKEASECRRIAKDLQEKVNQLTKDMRAKDDEILRLSDVIARQQQDAEEQQEVLASVRRASGPVTPLRLARQGCASPAFVISPGDDSQWGDDAPADFLDDSLSSALFRDNASIPGAAEVKNVAESGDPPLLHFKSLAHFNAVALAFGETASAPTPKSSSSKPPLAPASSALNVSGLVRSLSSKLTVPRRKRANSETDENTSGTGFNMVRVLSESKLRAVNGLKRAFHKV